MYLCILWDISGLDGVGFLEERVIVGRKIDILDVVGETQCCCAVAVRNTLYGARFWNKWYVKSEVMVWLTHGVAF